MRAIGTLILSLLICCLFWFLSRAGANRDRHQHRCRATAIAGLRAADLPGAGLHLDARLLGLG